MYNFCFKYLKSFGYFLNTGIVATLVVGVLQIKMPAQLAYAAGPLSLADLSVRKIRQKILLESIRATQQTLFWFWWMSPAEEILGSLENYKNFLSYPKVEETLDLEVEKRLNQLSVRSSQAFANRIRNSIAHVRAYGASTCIVSEDGTPFFFGVKNLGYAPTLSNLFRSPSVLTEEDKRDLKANIEHRGRISEMLFYSNAVDFGHNLYAWTEGTSQSVFGEFLVVSVSSQANSDYIRVFHSDLENRRDYLSGLLSEITDPFDSKGLHENNEDRVSQIATTYDHALILTKFGKIFRFSQRSPEKMFKRIMLPGLLDGEKVNEIAAGLEFSLFLTNRGRVFGQSVGHRVLGLEEPHDTITEINLASLGLELLNERIKKVAAGFQHMVLLTETGKVYYAGTISQFFENGGDGKTPLDRNDFKKLGKLTRIRGAADWTRRPDLYGLLVVL